MTRKEQKHDTGLRILEVLKILLNEDATKEEIIEIIKEKGNVENIYTQEAFLKYFNTLKLLGFELQREKYKYKLKNGLMYTNLSKYEKDVLYKVLDKIAKTHDRKLEKIYSGLIFKINKYIDVDIEEYLETKKTKISNSNEEDVKHNKLKTLEDILNENQAVKIHYIKSNNEQTSEIYEVKEINDKYVVCYSPKLGRNKKIGISSIISIERTPRRNSGISITNSIVFELYGRLVHSYRTKKSEKIIEYSPNHITVSNTEEDKELLMLRLLKYGENCKIVKPQYLQEEMIEITNEMLKNLGA